MTKSPAWFDLKRYSVLLDISNYELFQQVYFRIRLLTDPWPENEWLLSDHWFSQISKGTVCLETESVNVFGRTYQEFSAKEHNIIPSMDSTHHVSPISVNQLQNYSDIIDEEKENNPAFLGYASISEIMRDELGLVGLDEKKTVEMHIAIDLGASDKMIVDELVALLPKWRAQLGFNGAIQRTNGKTAQSFIKKLIDYKTIQTLDLYLWCKLQKISRYSVPELCELLFNSSESLVTPKQMHETHLKFMESLYSNIFYNTMQRWLMDDANARRLVKNSLL